MYITVCPLSRVTCMCKSLCHQVSRERLDKAGKKKGQAGKKKTWSWRFPWNRKRSVGNTAGCPGLPYRVQRATASLEARRGGLRLVSPSRAPQGKVRCITSHQSQPPIDNQWSRLVCLACVPFWNTGPYSLVSPPPTCAVQKPEKWRQRRHNPGNK